MKIWVSLLVIYAGFFLWYTDIGGKLDKEEIEFFLEKLEENASAVNLSLNVTELSQLDKLFSPSKIAGDRYTSSGMASLDRD